MAELAGPLRIMKIAIQTAKIAYPDYERERGTKWPDVLIPTKPPGSRASLADGLLSPAVVLGQAFLDCFAWVRHRLSPASSMR